MSELPISSPYRSTPQRPVAEDDRAALGRRLNDAYTSGALDELDYRSRLDTLYAATTFGELVPVVTGLPATDPNPTPAIVEQSGRPGEVSTARTPDLRRTALLVVGIGGAVAVVLIIVAIALLG